MYCPMEIRLLNFFQEKTMDERPLAIEGSAELLTEFSPRTGSMNVTEDQSFVNSNNVDSKDDLEPVSHVTVIVLNTVLEIFSHLMPCYCAF